MEKKRNGFLKCLFSTKYRPDGKRVENLDALQRMMPYVMKSRNHSCVYFRQRVNLTHTVDFIRQYNRDTVGEKISVFIIFLSAVIRTIALNPGMNRFIAGKRLYERNSLQLSYIVKQQMSVDGREVTVKQTFDLNDSLSDVAAKVNNSIERARRGENTDSDALINLIMKLPGFLATFIIAAAKALDNYGILPASIIESDPLFTSAFVANLGSIGIDATYHHLYEWGNASIFIVMGKYKKVESVDKDGSKKTQKMMDITFTIDERIGDGFYFSRALKLFKHLIENPEILLLPHEEASLVEQ